METLLMQFSYFTHTWEKGATEIRLEQFIDDVRSPRWAVLAQSYRHSLAQGSTKEAARLKQNLPAITVAGVFKGGHAAVQIRTFSGLMMVDLDHTDARTEDIKRQLALLPYVVAVFHSISAQGLKALVRIAVDNATQYAQAYVVVAQTIGDAIDFPCDMKCRDLGRMCYASYDPEAYHNPRALPFDWRGRAETPVTLASEALGSGLEVPFEGYVASGFLQGFLTDFGRRNVFEPGSRNDFLLKLGRAARYKEFSQSEVRDLIRLAVEQFAKDDLTDEFVEKRILSGYQYVDASPVGPSIRREAHRAQGSPAEPLPSESEEDDREDLLEKSGALRRSLPYFPDALFDRLPALLTQGVRLSRDARERDMLLMGMLVNISGCLPNVKLLYDQLYCSPHFYFVAIAHAGGGKGVLSLAALLPGAINRHYERQNEERMRAHRETTIRWEQEERAAQREKRLPDLSLAAEPPKLITLKVSPNISKSRLILYLEGNGKLGVIINAPELDMVSGAIRQDCGKHDDVFRAAFQHEEVSSDYKVDGRQVMAHHPHLACCFSGTPAQLSNFVLSLENGLFSRLGIYAGEGEWRWRSAEPRQAGVDYRAVFSGLSERLLEMHLFLLQSPTEVTFSPQQWKRHTERFGCWLQNVVGEREDSPGAIVLRHGLVAMRIAAVLTVLRKCECAFAMPEYRCTDEDFETAMQLVEVLLEHTLLVSTSLLSQDKKIRPLKAFFRLRPVLERLNVDFTYREFMNEARKNNLPESTAKRLLSKAVRNQLIGKEGDVYRNRGLRSSPNDT